MTSSIRRFGGHISVCALAVCLLAVCWSSRAAAQGTPTNATLKEWDIFAATGGNGDASQNVAAVFMDVSGIAGPAGNVWVTLQNPLPRLGRLDPAAATNNYVEWRPISAAEGGGPPLGLALNRSNADIWVAMQGDPSFVMKLGGVNTFRRFRHAYPLVPHGIVVASDNAAIAALPVKNTGGIGDAIVKVPRNPTSGQVTMTIWQVGGQPRHVTLDNSGNIWYGAVTSNKLARLNPATGVVTEWLLPSGTNPAGVRTLGSIVCIVSEGGVADLTGVEHCLNTTNNQITQYARAPGDGFNFPQQNSPNADTESFITEQNGNSLSFVAFAARAAAPVVTVTPTTRTVAPKTTKLTVSDYTVTPTTVTVASAQTSLPGVDNGGGYVRFSLPAVALTFPFDQTGNPQPMGMTPVFNDVGRGTGAIYFGQYFDGPMYGRTPAGRVARLELSTAALPKTIVTNPTTLRFDAMVGQPAPGAQAIALTEAGGQPLAWTATKTATWLTLTPASGSAPSSVSVTIDHSALTAGTYTDTITIDDGPGAASPKVVDVTLNVIGRPTITLGPTSLTFAGSANGARTPPQTLNITNTGSGTLDWTGTADQTWVVVGPVSGTAPSDVSVLVDPGTLGQGTFPATLTFTSPTATNSPLTLGITANITNAPPLIGLSPASMTFNATRGQPAPAGQTLTISNTGGGTLAWGASPSAPWLVLSPATGSVIGGQSGTAQVTVDQAALPHGTFNGTIQISDPNVSNSPQTMSVSLTVLAATIGVSPASLTPTAVRTLASPANQVLTVSNIGTAPLNYTATIIEGVSWLSVAGGATGTVAPAGSAPVTLAFSTSGLAKGVHTATVEIDDPNADNTPQLITVTLTVTAPVIAPSPASLAFSVNQGLNPSSQILTVTNNGDAPLTFTPAVATQSGGAWLSVSPSGQVTIPAAANTPFTVNIASAALASGLYNGSITMTDATATNSPQVVPVSLTVTTVPVLTVTPTTIPVIALKGGSNPPNQTVTISNTGGQNFTYSVGAPSAAWLSIFSGGGGGTLTPAASAPLVLAIDITGLAKGNYSATVVVTAPGASNSPTTITVNLTIQAPTINLTPSSIPLSVVRTLPSPANQTVAVGNTGDATLAYNATVTSGGSWLSIFSGGSGSVAPAGSANLVLALNTTALAKGVFTGTVSVADPNASNSPQTITVTLTVTAPIITPSPTSLSFTVDQGLNPASQNLTVTNDGDSALTFTPGINTTSGGSWLSISPATQQTINAGQNVVFSVSIASAALAPTSYSGSVTMTDATATNSPQVVPVTLTVNAVGVLTVSPTTVPVTAIKGFGNPANQTVTISNTGGASFSYSTGAPSASWLTVFSGGSGTLAPSASAPLVLAIDITGLAKGNYSATVQVTAPGASNSPTTITVNLTVQSGTISLDRTSIPLSVARTLASPGNETVVVTNTGDATLNYTASVTSGASWLSISSGGSGAVAPSGASNLVLAFNTTALAKGVFTGTVSVADPNASNSPQTITVTLTVRAPIITPSPTSLTFNVNRGANPATQTVRITNDGDAPLNFTPSITAGAPGGWLAVSPSGAVSLAPGAFQDFTVTITSASLTSATYNGSITVTDSTATNSPLSVGVTLTVNPFGILGVSPTTINLAARKGGVNPGNQSVTISNTGDAQLAYSTSAPTAAWLTIASGGTGTVNGGGPSATLALGINITGLAKGNYSASVTVSSANANNSPQTVTVNLTIQASTIVVANTADSVLRTKIKTQVVTVGNQAGADANLIYTATVTSGTWLSITGGATGTVLAGNTANMTLQYNASALTLAGSPYTGTISVADSGATNTPQTITVTLTVLPVALIQLQNLPTNWPNTPQYRACGTGFAGATLVTKTIRVSNNGDVGSTLNYTVGFTSTPGAVWVSTPTTPIPLAQLATQDLTLVANLAPGGTALAAATHVLTTTVTDPNAQVTSATDPVQVIVQAPGTNRYLCVIGAGTPTPGTNGTMSYTVTKGTTSAGQVLTIRNAGAAGTAMPWTLVTTTPNPPAGITFTRNAPNTGSLAFGTQANTGAITVTVTAGTASGTYTGTLRVTGTTAQGTPKDITVTIVVP